MPLFLYKRLQILYSFVPPMKRLIMAKLESSYQNYLVQHLENLYPDALVMKNDPNYRQGIPDIIVLIGSTYGIFEVKRSSNEHHQPNQDWYVNHICDCGGFASFIYPENETQVLESFNRFLNN